MNRPARMSVYLTVATTLGLARPVFPWGCEGHQTVAYIARAQLSPNALAHVDKLLRNNPISPQLKRFCKSQGLTRLADVSTWADDVRDQDTEDWHFLDIPRGASRSDVSSFCPSKGCVTKAIGDQLNTLKTSTDPAEQAKALRFVVHFVGDIHQPLHCSTNNDRGGNCVKVTFFGAPTSCTTKKCTPNLHGIWDTNLIRRDPKFAAPKTYAAKLRSQFQSQIPTWKQGGTNFEDWAWDSSQRAEQTAYGKLPTAIPIQQHQPVANCDDPASIAVTMPALNEAIGQKYATAATPVIEEQLAKAGTRLAMLLNEVWP